MIDLEERALNARRAVERSIERVELGEFTPRHPLRTGATVVAALLVVALGLGGWWATARGGDTAVATDGDLAESAADDANPDPMAGLPGQPGTIRYFVLDPPPTGYLALIIPSEQFGRRSSGVSFDLYGRANAVDPFVDGDLAVATTSSQEEVGGDPFEIDGMTVWYDDRVLSWIGEDGSAVAVMSTSMSREQLTEAARSLISTGKIDPRGLDLLANYVDVPIGELALPSPADVIYGVNPGPVVAGAQTISVTIDGPPSVDTDLVATWLAGFERPGRPSAEWARLSTETVTFEGREVTVTRRGSGVVVRLEYEIDGGSTATVLAVAVAGETGVDVDALLALTKSIREATAAEVEQLLEAGALVVGPEDEAPGELDESPGPGQVVPARAIGVDPVDGSWSSPEHLGLLDSSSVVAVVPNSNKVVHLERSGLVIEGCEGGEQPTHRLVLTDLDTGGRTVLVEELELTDQSVELGPGGRVAIVGGCDANAWLAAVGSIQADGTFVLNRLSDAPEEQIYANNNAGVNVTWSANGAVLYLNSVAVDAETGERLSSGDRDEPLQIHAELADGSRLVSPTDVVGESTPFWLIEPGRSVDVIPTQLPALVGQARYPAAQVEISADGQRVLVVVDQWTTSERTLVIGGDEIIQVAGAASLSPDGSRLITRTGTDTETLWTVVDLASGSARLVPTPSEAGPFPQAQWAGDGQGLLITAPSPSQGSQDPLNLWYIKPNPS